MGCGSSATPKGSRADTLKEAAITPIAPTKPTGLQGDAWLSEALGRLEKELGSSPRICILGGTEFKGADTEELVKATAAELAAKCAAGATILTGGMGGVQKAFALSCGDGSLVKNLLPEGQASGYGVGKDIFAGRDLEQRKALFGCIGDIYVTFEGGPGVAQEANDAVARGALVVPFVRTGGASSGMFAFPAAALEKPSCASAEQWAALKDPEAPVAAAAAAAAAIVSSQLEVIKSRHGGPAGAPAEAASALIDVKKLTRTAADDLGLLAQPAAPKFRGAVVQIFVRSQPYGGSDKSSNGHRYDSIPFANGMILAGMSCQLIHYVHEEHDGFFEVAGKFDFLIVRCNPGQIKADGGDQMRFDDGMRALRKKGIQVWPSPDVMEKMGAKDALCKIAKLNIGLEDTLAYYTEEEFLKGFKKTMAFQPRVIKQNRGSSGEGIWIIKLKEGNYCSTFGERVCEGSEVLDMMEANDNHAEEHTVDEFVEFCLNGRNEKSGEWKSQGVGKYLEGGKEAGGQLVDQRFCPRIVEGELRYNCIGGTLVGIIHKKPKEGGISAVGGTGSVYTYYGPDEPKFASLTKNFLTADLPLVMPALDLADEPVPLWWTTDFILASPEGTPVEEEKWIVGEFNCSCVGISKCLAAYCKDDTPTAKFSDISAEDMKDVNNYATKLGTTALGIMEKRK